MLGLGFRRIEILLVLVAEVFVVLVAALAGIHNVEQEKKEEQAPMEGSWNKTKQNL